MRTTHRERHRMQRIGWLRAAVLGANDGIVSTASLVGGRSKRDEGRATRNILGCTGHGRDRRRWGSFRKGCLSGFRILR
jgi:VIT1/CCC1 family predicted Fe2+/Mn2+ transporter